MRNLPRSLRTRGVKDIATDKCVGIMFIDVESLEHSLLHAGKVANICGSWISSVRMTRIEEDKL